MPIAPTTFSHLKALASTHNFRAYADVVITDPTRTARSSVFQCLVDTGSDYTILPLSAATAVGISPSGPRVTFRTAGGTVYHLPSHTSTDLIIEGYSLRVAVAFSSSTAFSPILGRVELVSAFDVGFDTTNWYWA